MARTTQFPPSVKAGIPQEPKAPEGWKLVRFGDVIQVAERPVELDDDQEYQLVTAKRSRGGIVPREKLLGKNILTKTQFYINAGDFLISRRQIIHGACGLVPPDLDGALVSNEYSALLTTNSLLKEYLAYFSHTNYFQQTCFQSSVGVDVEKMIFKLEDWLKYKFPLPPVKEQKKITEILGSVDDAIDATQAVIDQTRKVKQGLLQQLLTRGIGHTKFKETAIGLIPSHWELVALGDIGSFQNGINKKKEDFGFGFHFINLQDVFGVNYISTKPNGLVNASLKELPIFSLKKGDILFVRSSVKPEGVGLTAVITEDLDDVVYSGFLIRFRQKEERLLTEFSKYCFYEPRFRQDLLSKSSVSANTNINQPALESLLLPLPPASEQEQIAQSLYKLECEINQSQKTRTHFLSIKQGLMQDLLTGRVRVNG